MLYITVHHRDVIYMPATHQQFRTVRIIFYCIEMAYGSDERKYTQKYVIFVVAARVELVKHKTTLVSQSVRRSVSSPPDQAELQIIHHVTHATFPSVFN